MNPTNGSNSDGPSMATVLLHPDVESRLQSLPNDVESRVRSKLEDAGDDPERHLKPLRGREEYSLRVGKRRAIIDWVRRSDELRVLEIDTRDTVYR
ncbi:type II toxin-antitoxin system RelE family toxin [Halorussus ruber]|uniref:type II toxin-antitoxin system RelE family toxin n=1 Tax=Halorussus ruber TaxID=1126238 RepID=UPI001092EC11|nr:hypothetical protein [Halorussus ruber]